MSLQENSPKQHSQPEFSEEQHTLDDELKKAGLEAVLGTMNDVVLHAIFPYAVGGALDVYAFPNHIAGTGLVSMELLRPDGSGPAPNTEGTYELIMFTKHKPDFTELWESPFRKMVFRCCMIMTNTALYSAESGDYAVVFNSNETCTFPIFEDENVFCFFHKYADFWVGERKHHLLLIMEVLEREQDFARQEGTEKLLSLLKEQGYYPYSDLDRPPVV